MTTFTTPRLTVRPWDEALTDGRARGPLETRLRALLTPAVLSHLPPGFGPGNGPDAMPRWIETRREWAQVSLVERDGDLIGLLFLFTPGGGNEHHLGYLLAEDAWGQGYATELVQGLAARQRANPPAILHAGVAAENPASARVLLKAGFEEIAPGTKDGLRNFVHTFEKTAPPKG